MSEMAPEYKEVVLKQIIRTMTNLHRDYSLLAQDVAEELGLGVREVRKLLEEELGTTFRGLLNEMRLKTAKELTLSGEARGWREVALKAGFNDSRYFSRIFKRQEGCTWSEWKAEAERALLREKGIPDLRKEPDEGNNKSTDSGGDGVSCSAN